MAPTLTQLHDLLPLASIDLGADVADRDAAIRLAGAMLVAAGCVAPTYVDDMLERENSVSTFVGDGIAMPHGTVAAKSGVLHDGLAVVRLAHPVDWSGERVTIVIAIAAHGRRYITLLSQLATALLAKGRADELRATTDAADVFRLLST